MHPSRFRAVPLLLVVLLALVAGACSSGGWGEMGDRPDLLSYDAVWAFAPDDVLVVGSPQMGETTAAARYDGAGWTLEDVGVYYLADIWAFSPADIWAVGGRDVLHYDGAAWHKTSLGDQGARDLLGIWGTGPTALWVVGEGGVFHFDGTTWRNISRRNGESIWGTPPGELWTFGIFDFMHYDGQTWSDVDVDDPHGGHGDFWGFGDDDVFLAGDDERLFRWDGADWQAIGNDDIFGDLRGVWGPGPEDVWAVGAFGEVARFDGDRLRSIHRQPQGAPYLMYLTAVHGSSADDVWAVGYKLSDSGNRGVIFHHEGP